MRRTTFLVALHVASFVPACNLAVGGDCVECAPLRRDAGADGEALGVDAASPPSSSATPAPTSSAEPPPSSPSGSCGAMKIAGGATCQSCFESACCAYGKMCSASPKCLEFGQCAGACGSNISCMANCATKNMTGYNEYVALTECMQTGCPACVK